MWFLIKGGFWFSMVLVLLPIFDRGSSQRLENGPKVEFSDAFSAATGAYEYVSALCVEKPDVCEKGSETFTAMGHRAREGARLAYEFLDEKFAAEPGAAKTNKLAAVVDENDTLAIAADQPMPKALNSDDDVVTGTIIPLPMKRPVL